MQAPQITIYATHTCSYCQLEKAWLDAHQISYEVKYVDDNPDLADELLTISGQLAVPVTVLTHGRRQEIIIGFDRPHLAHLLGVAV